MKTKELTTQQFADAVRKELADLNKDEVAELTDGLEADLAERTMEEGNELGSPITYAAELRAAAGFNPKIQPAKVGVIQRIGDWINRTAHSNRTTAALYDFANSMRPVWWIIRAWLAWVLGVSLIDGWSANRLVPSNGTHLVVLPLLILLSIQWGRGKWFRGKFFTKILAPLNLIALLLVPVGLSQINSAVDSVTSMENDLMTRPDLSGLLLNGAVVSAIHAKDASGTYVEGLTFTDQDGNQLLQPSEPQLITVPNVIGMRLPDAMKVFADAGFTGGGDMNYLNGADDITGVVKSTTPAAGEVVYSKTIIYYDIKPR